MLAARTGAGALARPADRADGNARYGLLPPRGRSAARRETDPPRPRLTRRAARRYTEKATVARRPFPASRQLGAASPRASRPSRFHATTSCRHSDRKASQRLLESARARPLRRRICGREDFAGRNPCRQRAARSRCGPTRVKNRMSPWPRTRKPHGLSPRVHLEYSCKMFFLMWLRTVWVERPRAQSRYSGVAEALLTTLGLTGRRSAAAVRGGSAAGPSARRLRGGARCAGDGRRRWAQWPHEEVAHRGDDVGPQCAVLREIAVGARADGADDASLPIVEDGDHH